MQIRYVSTPPGLVRKAVTLAGAVVLAGLALMFSVVLLTVIVIVGVIGGAILWWKTREIRRQMRELARNHPPGTSHPERDIFSGGTFKGEVIEGEVVRVHESMDGPGRH